MSFPKHISLFLVLHTSVYEDVCDYVYACSVHACVCVSHMVQWYVQSISNREVAGSIPDDYGRTRLSSLSRILPDFSFILLGGYQQPVYAGVCGVVCV